MALHYDGSASESESSDEALDEAIISPLPTTVFEDQQSRPPPITTTKKPTDSSGTSTPSDQGETPEPLTMTPPSARAYQLEMLEVSLKGNVIVAMDTGSGKTRVAVLRIIKELERSEKRVWFLAPTVELADQQFRVLQAQIAVVQSRLILGSDNVDAWSDQRTWDAVLLNIRIVVSTFQILFDAVQHDFVRLDSLSLIVIDEAHNCVKMNAAARLMKEFYRPTKAAGHYVPHILGLTASPLMRFNLDGIDILEDILDAVCRTPTLHREELLAQVNRPEMITVPYGTPADSTEVTYSFATTRTMASLRQVYHQLDIMMDPYILRLLKSKNTPRTQEAIRKAMEKHNTYCQRQMESFCARALEICKQLGPWAADYYIWRVISEFTEANTLSDETASEEERIYLAAAFKKVETPPPFGVPDDNDLSPKARALLNILQQDRENPMGIVFVKERATVAVLSHVLSVHPISSSHQKTRFRVGSVVGTSKMPGRRRDFLDLSRKEDIFSLDNFRKGKTNLLVATSVLEEGIDVPACNLVICFDKLTSPKSFIQRRGRARMTTSQLYLLVEDETDESAAQWRDFEERMKQRYEDDMRERKLLEDLEGVVDGEFADYPILVANKTGARLTVQDAKGHLQHFCASLSTRRFVDWTPYYIFHDVEGNPVTNVSQQTLLKATVYLPASLNPEHRRFTGMRAWYSERQACMDAAFVAYRALYEVGLVNDNLLPLREADVLGLLEQRAGFALVKEQLDPWYNIALAWKQGKEMFRRRLTILGPADRDQDGDQSMRSRVTAEFELALPVPIPYMGPLAIWWDRDSRWEVSVGTDMSVSSKEDDGGVRLTAADDTEEPEAKDHTGALLAFAFGYRQRYRKPVVPGVQYAVRLVSLDRPDLNADDMSRLEFAVDMVGRQILPQHLIRHPVDFDHPYIYMGHMPTKPTVDLIGRPYRGFNEAPEDAAYVVVRNWPKKAGFFRQPNPQPSKNLEVPLVAKPYPRVLPADQVRVDSIPSVFTHAGMLVPAITSALEIHLVAADLLAARLSELDITEEHLSLVVTAICATAARAPTDYERIEFLGDSILKFCTTINAAAKNLLWPEGYLSLYKDKIVANSRLARAAVDFGLDRYIIYKSFTLHKWQPMNVDELLEKAGNNGSATKMRQLPTKTLADVVEALIGVAYIVGGGPKALQCISMFLPDVKWQSIDDGREILYNNALSRHTLPVTMRPLEELIGYSFTKKSLLVEAMTHCSYTGPDSIACLDRLEFVGDSILDYVVVKHLFGIVDPRPLENSEMHLLRTALVNGDLLAFLVMEWALDVEITVLASPDNDPISSAKEKAKIPFWSFMRHSSPDIGMIQRETGKRYEALRGEIHEALFGNGTTWYYPWAQLARLQAQKSYSDIFESLLGAVWVDSGSLDECEKVVERIGILPLFRRLRQGGVHMLHPKEELGRLAGNLKVDYQVAVAVTGLDEREFECRVVLGEERCVAHVDKCLTKEEARVRAAAEACRVLKAESS
ncbi:hypothetical protein B0H66DRAFT_606212 [Apodospora peruviana]|uniref:Dicer-like protein 2 n=1 Tax=Apodospora peruviana TaxID=516989 RepID=A0AAE0HYS8_9PEZI|nr:hypothetical protein B0H66DRAFT_606212 [Apodospora peruviana]